MTDASRPLLRTLRSMNATLRFLLLGGVAVAVVGVWLVSRWASAPTYVALYRDLDLSESGAIADHLGKTAIPYRLEGGGTEVMVPVADVARARVALAKQGLPTTGRPGLELFDKPSWGMTDFTQRVTYQRALEGELARTIGGLKGVQRAQVHLVLPTTSPIRRLERAASASVMLTLKSGATLSAEAVQGITYVVSNSVEQLASDNVAVMDDAGHVLSVPAAPGSSAGATTRQLEIQRSVEQNLASKVEDLLDTVVGMGRSRAQISAQLSFDQTDRTVETFDPDGQVLQNEQRSETGAGGAPDAAGSQTIVNNTYQNTHKLEKNVSAAGSVTRLTVAVLVDEKAIKSGGVAGGQSLKLDALESMVRNTIGADSARGDRVTLMAVPFEPTAIQAAAAAGPAGEVPKADPILVVEKVTRPAVGVIAIVALLLLGLKLMPSAKGSTDAAERAAMNGGESGIPGALTPQGVSEVALLRHRLQAESGERPETTAQVVRAWLSEPSS